jgi:transcriptional regulator with XRE-family HTH domain
LFLWKELCILLPSESEIGMTTAQTRSEPLPDAGLLLAKAAIRSAQAMGLSQADLAAVIGLSPASVSRLKDGTLALTGKTFELAACLVRVFRSLDAIVGGDRDTMRGWMRSPNSDLHGIPGTLIRDVAGLVGVMAYLDAARAPV